MTDLSAGASWLPNAAPTAHARLLSHFLTLSPLRPNPLPCCLGKVLGLQAAARAGKAPSLFSCMPFPVSVLTTCFALSFLGPWLVCVLAYVRSPPELLTSLLGSCLGPSILFRDLRPQWEGWGPEPGGLLLMGCQELLGRIFILQLHLELSKQKEGYSSGKVLTGVWLPRSSRLLPGALFSCCPTHLSLSAGSIPFPLSQVPAGGQVGLHPLQ